MAINTMTTITIIVDFSYVYTIKIMNILVLKNGFRLLRLQSFHLETSSAKSASTSTVATKNPPPIPPMNGPLPRGLCNFHLSTVLSV